MNINIPSIGLRGVGAIFGVSTSVLQIGQSLGTIIFGALIGILIWSIIDLIFRIFQDRPTQGVNSGISFFSSFITFPYFSSIGFPFLLLGLSIGFVVAIVLDWKFKKK